MAMRREERNAVWCERVAAQAGSGLSGRPGCAREGLSYWNFMQWRRRLSRGHVAERPMTFVHVSVTAARNQALVIQVGAVRIEVGSGFDAVLLRRVVAALG